jgi:hypothetical protein
LFLSLIFVLCSFFSFFCFSSKNFLFQQQVFLVAGTSSIFSFVLSSSLFFSSNTNTLYTGLWNKLMLKSMEYSEQPQAQIWAKVLGGRMNDQL